MSRPLILLACCAVVSTAPLQAETVPLPHSQDSYASACLDYEDSLEQIARFCELALSEPGASRRQRLAMMENLGDALLSLDQLDRSEAAFRQILELEPVHGGALSGLGWVAETREDFAAAIPLFERSLDVSLSAPALAGLAVSRYQLGDLTLDAVLGQLDMALALDETYGWAARQKGWYLLDADRSPEAELAFQEALAISASNHNALLGLSRSLRDQDQLRSALAPLIQALQEDPEWTVAYADRSFLYWLLDWNKLALRDAERVITDWPNRATGYVAKARALSDLGRRDDALAVFEAGAAKVSFSSYLIYYHALYLKYDARYDDAAEQLYRLVEGGDPDVYDYQLLAEVELERGNLEAAERAVQGALDFGDADPETRFLNAQLLASQGATEAAVTEFDIALDQGLDWERYSTLSSILFAQGAMDEAVALRRRYTEWQRLGR